MKPDELADVVADLVVRVAALEAGRTSGSPIANNDLSIVRSLVSELAASGDGAVENGTVLYAGAGTAAGGVVAWQMDRSWTELTELESSPIARLLAALGNPQRVQIVQALIHSPATTAELSGRLDEPSTGQLFHHLKELLAAGLVYQPQRGTYAIRQQHIVPLLTVISCGLDLAT
jgi:DNA-binding transcriptional ArsR family regulator